MLEKEDLQALRAIIKEEIDASEQRMTQRMDQQRKDIMSDVSTMMSQQRKDIMHDVAVLIDAEVKPQFNLLAEGHQTLLDTLAPKNRVEALEDEIVFMKSVIKALAQDIQELKKAQ